MSTGDIRINFCDIKAKKVHLCTWIYNTWLAGRAVHAQSKDQGECRLLLLEHTYCTAWFKDKLCSLHALIPSQVINPTCGRLSGLAAVVWTKTSKKVSESSDQGFLCFVFLRFGQRLSSSVWTRAASQRHLHNPARELPALQRPLWNDSRWVTLCLFGWERVKLCSLSVSTMELQYFLENLVQLCLESLQLNLFSLPPLQKVDGPSYRNAMMDPRTSISCGTAIREASAAWTVSPQAESCQSSLNTCITRPQWW